MYNRYVPDGTSYVRMVEQDTSVSPPPRESSPPPPRLDPQPHGYTQNTQWERTEPPASPRGSALFRGLEGMGELFKGREDGLASLLNGKSLSGLTALLGKRDKAGGGLSALLRTLNLEDIDAGDILLLLIILFLLIEGDDLELVIALGLVLIMGLGKEEKD